MMQVAEAVSAKPAQRDGLDLDPARRYALLEAARHTIFQRLGQVVSEALDRMGAELGARASKLSGREEQQALLGAVSRVEQKRGELEQGFASHFRQTFERRLHALGDEAADQGGAGIRNATGDEGDGLTLVDDDTIRTRLKLDRLAHRARARLDNDEVLGIRARLAALVGRDWFSESRHPVAPDGVFGALHEALEEIDFDPVVRSALLDCFEPYVTANLNAIYAQVNEDLRSSNVLARIKPRVEVSRDGASRVRKAAEAGLERAEPVQDPSSGAGDGRPQRLVPADAIVLPADHGQREAILAALAQQVAQGAPQARSSAVRMLAEPKNFGMADLPIPEVDGRLIQALDSMQGMVGEHHDAPASALQAISTEALEKGSPLDQLTVEIVSLIFDFIYNDPRIPEPVKNQLLRLQVVAVKAALLDRSFFARKQHPMRRLIDRATEVSCDPHTDAGEKSAFVRGLKTIVSDVLAEFDRDLQVFESAVYKLDELALIEEESRAAQLGELTRKAEQAEATTIAQAAATRALESRIDELTPAFVREFLTDWWVKVMIAAYLPPPDGERATADAPAGPAQASEWDLSLRLAEQLLWSVAPKDASQVGRLASLLPRMISGLTTALKTIDIPRAVHDAFFNELLKWHTRSIKEAKAIAERGAQRIAAAAAAAAAVHLRDDGTVAFDRLAAGVAEPVVAQPTPESALDGLRKGQQMDWRSGTGEPVRVKLAWISPARSLYALSRSPDFARSVPRAEMVAMIQSGRLVPVTEQATVDRVIDKVGGPAADAPAPDAAGGSARHA